MVSVGLPRRRSEQVFLVLAFLALAFPLGTLVLLLVDVIQGGAGRLSLDFLTSFPSRHPEQAGILSAFVGSIYLLLLTGCFAVPLGIGAAVYLEKYASRNWFNHLMEINIGTLAGVPSIIYGLLGLGLCVRVLMLGRSLLAGALTLALLVLPIVIIASREAIRAVPSTLEDASYALGATKSNVIFTITLPLALPGILTGIILALSRAIGETAPLITIGALTYIAFLPNGLHAPFTAMPIQIFNWVSRPQAGFHTNAAAAIIILLLLTFLFNALAVFIRNRSYSHSSHQHS